MDITFNNYRECIEIYDKLEKERIQLETVELYNEINSFINENIVELDYDSELYTEEVLSKSQKWYQKLWEWIKKVWKKIVTFFTGDKSLIKQQAKEIKNHKEEIEKNSSSSEYISSHSSGISSSLGNIASAINTAQIDKKEEIIKNINDLIKGLNNKSLKELEKDSKYFHDFLQIGYYFCVTYVLFARSKFESLMNLYNYFNAIWIKIKIILEQNNKFEESLSKTFFDIIFKKYFYYSIFLKLITFDFSKSINMLINRIIQILFNKQEKELKIFHDNQISLNNNFDPSTETEETVLITINDIFGKNSNYSNSNLFYFNNYLNDTLTEILQIMNQSPLLKHLNQFNSVKNLNIASNIDIKDAIDNDISLSTLLKSFLSKSSSLNYFNNFNGETFKQTTDYTQIQKISNSYYSKVIKTNFNKIIDSMQDIMANNIDEYINFFKIRLSKIFSANLSFMNIADKIINLYKEFYESPSLSNP